MKEKIIGIVTILSASLASICCIGPIVLVGLGLGGAGLAMSLEKYRLLFLGLTVLLLGFAFYLTYRKRQVTCEDGSCDLRSGSKTMKVTLWTITIVALSMATFPNWSALMLSGPAAPVSADAEMVVLEVSGMTCTLCAVSIEKSLKKITGVEAASVSFDNAEAVVYLEPGMVVTENLLKAVQDAGSYTAKVKKVS